MKAEDRALASSVSMKPSSDAMAQSALATLCAAGGEALLRLRASRSCAARRKPPPLVTPAAATAASEDNEDDKDDDEEDDEDDEEEEENDDEEEEEDAMRARDQRTVAVSLALNESSDASPLSAVRTSAEMALAAA